MEEAGKVVKCLRHRGETVDEEVVHRNDLKVGDIIKIENGMNIPVDGIVVSAIGVMSDESAMTGESDHLPKEALERCRFRQRDHEEDVKATRDSHDVPSPVILSGTQIQTGQGWFVCCIVGEGTCEGQIMAAIGPKAGETTPLQDKLDVIAVDIGKVGMYAALLIFHVLVLRLFIESLARRDFDIHGGPREWYHPLVDRSQAITAGKCFAKDGTEK